MRQNTHCYRLPKYLNLSAVLCTFGITTLSADVVTRASTIIKADHYGLSNMLFNDGVPMSYDPLNIDSTGAAFSADYTDPNLGTGGMDAYLSGAIGGIKTGGVWYPGDPALSGMPVQLQHLDYDFRIRWSTFQINANDADDKWWATTNVIFDGGAELAEPVTADRDFDIVIQLERYEQDELTDKAKGTSGSYWWFARNADQSIRPFTLKIDGVDYEWAVRYKFFVNSGDKDNKVHIKFIPIDNNNVAPYLDHPLRLFTEASVDYLQSINLPAEELALAYEKVADPNLWVKAITAGYEVYTGTMTLGQDEFRTVVDNTAPDAATNLTISTNEVGSITLDWEDSSETSLQAYDIWRATDGGDFENIAVDVTNSSYIDISVSEGSAYDYAVTTVDRSFNESAFSNVASIVAASSNQAPVWNVSNFALPAIAANIDYVKWIKSRFNDPEGDTVSLTIVSGPSWLSVTNPTNAKIEGAPTNADAGINTFIVSISDGIHAPVEATMTIEVLAVPFDVHVADIAMSGNSYSGRNKTGVASITVLNDSGVGVPNATVDITWSGATSSTDTAVTDANGTVTFESAPKKKGGTFTITVDSVTGSDLNYSPADNIETSDSITNN